MNNPNEPILPQYGHNIFNQFVHKTHTHTHTHVDTIELNGGFDNLKYLEHTFNVSIRGLKFLLENGVDI